MSVLVVQELPLIERQLLQNKPDGSEKPTAQILLI